MNTRTWTRRIAAGFTSIAALTLTATALAAPASARPASARPASARSVSLSSADLATATVAGKLPTSLTDCSADFFGADKRLGPASLPKLGLLGLELFGYHRTGKLNSTAFLTKYYDPTLYGGTGGWIYPPDNGYQLKKDGTPMEWQQPLRTGQSIDRFGSEYGAFLSPLGSPYFTRAIPPSNLDGTPAADCNYREYQVLKPFTVDAGPIAAWFEQPGGGLQYQLDATLLPGAPTTLNVLWLVDNGYLKRLN